MNVGSLNNRITIQKRTLTKIKGIPIESWDTFYTCWCSINSLYGAEVYKAIEVSLENVLNFTVRYTSSLENLNTKEYRIIWKTRTFNIIATDYYSFSKEKITLKSKEVI